MKQEVLRTLMLMDLEQLLGGGVPAAFVDEMPKPLAEWMHASCRRRRS